MLSREQIASNQEGIKAPARPLPRLLGRPRPDGQQRRLAAGAAATSTSCARSAATSASTRCSSTRPTASGSRAPGLSFIELNYVLLQAYDFLHLYREYGCTLQVGGSDQWFNILAGAELIRRADGGEAFALVAPLITDRLRRQDGQDRGRRRLARPGAHQPVRLLPVLGQHRGRRRRAVPALLHLPARGRDQAPRGARRRRAAHAPRRSWPSRSPASSTAKPPPTEAQQAARALFGGDGGSLDAVPTTAVPAERLADGIDVVELLVLGALAPSRGAARRLIEQGGAYLGDRRVDAPDSRVTRDQLGQDGLLVRAGKKRFHRFIVAAVVDEIDGDCRNPGRAPAPRPRWPSRRSATYRVRRGVVDPLQFASRSERHNETEDNVMISKRSGELAN